ncbi:hypothetical protein Verru16b_01321 [Lacunisphaera limnophila]|uniref:Bacteriocin-protection, YdeI or OmpD-Associated n=1 Tax=Lacunisphaera limnophila TaxID=1838286 RepID=A0A1D8ATR7_9BACT|nr:YdeI/OmpD-associated family protein [Lacunisphaera limnophila]AOS44260.1 hypothetical protein Verru16b_01321 [Lacunisphaera limnophila]
MSKPSPKTTKPELPILAFASPAAFRRWLKANHGTHPGIWLQIAKKDSGIASVTYAEALDEALCYGWIDGQKQSHDQQTFLQKFTRRGPRSTWSKINVGHVARLTQAGRMQPAGQAMVDAAQADGRWTQAYASSRAAEMPADFLAQLAPHARAKAFFESLNAANRYAIYYRQETRDPRPPPRTDPRHDETRGEVPLSRGV